MQLAVAMFGPKSQPESGWAMLVGASATPINGSEASVRPTAQRRSGRRVVFIVKC